MNRFLLPLTALIAGILAERYGNFGLWTASGLLIIGALFNLILNLILRTPVSKVAHSNLYWLGFIPMFAGVGIFCACLTPRESERQAAACPEYLRWKEGLKPDEPVFIDVDKKVTGEYGDRISGRIIYDGSWNGWGITSFCGVTDVVKGDIVKVPAKSVNGKFAKANEVKIIQKRRDRRRWYEILHDKLINHIDGTGLSLESRGLLKALLGGDADSVSSDTRHHLADSGLAHMLALSGMHVGIAAALALLLLWPLKFCGWWKLRHLLALIPVWIFVAMSGMSPSTLRAAIMFSCVTLALILERMRSGFSALLLAAFIILIVNPDSIFNAGFQLSFVCVASLIGFVEPLNTIDHRSHPVTYKIVSWILVPLIATGASWVLSSYYFGRIPLDFLPLNLIAVPLLPLYIGISLIYLSISGSGIGVGWLENFIDTPYSWLRSASECLSQGTVIEYRLESWEVLVWLSVLALLGWRLNRHSKNAMPPLPGSKA